MLGLFFLKLICGIINMVNWNGLQNSHTKGLVLHVVIEIKQCPIKCTLDRFGKSRHCLLLGV